MSTLSSSIIACVEKVKEISQGKSEQQNSNAFSVHHSGKREEGKEMKEKKDMPIRTYLCGKI